MVLVCIIRRTDPSCYRGGRERTRGGSLYNSPWLVTRYTTNPPGNAPCSDEEVRRRAHVYVYAQQGGENTHEPFKCIERGDLCSPPWSQKQPAACGALPCSFLGSHSYNCPPYSFACLLLVYSISQRDIEREWARRLVVMTILAYVTI